ncbi:hypothetical protein MNBD_BACTEROID06-735 [hydrothermal vent metagenome]|uniref:Outer membrane protein beta-barrel domain-containing protein n=1 Tax=hydrothermal vent metagenome TaxID=652676 RepID=A0A3B0UM58_9ZZZZ
MKTISTTTTLLIIFICTILTPGLAQSDSLATKTIIEPQNALSFVPQYAIANGIRIDYERRIKNGNTWIVVAPMLFIDNSNNSYYYNDGSYASYETMTGGGVNVYFKNIVYKSNKINWKSGLPRHSLYLSAGPSYQRFTLTNTEEVAVPFIDNGITYYQFDVQDVKKPINRYGAVADVGWQLAFDRFLLDLYLGVAFKYSTGEGGAIIRTPYSGWIDIDYSGILLDGGLRLGMFF